jgi:POT family proton-dependent oligopeptide transporter
MATATEKAPTAAPGFFTLITQHPIGFWFIFWGEFAERCSYYGMRAILATYMAEKLGLGKGNSFLYMSLFIGACYCLPVIGGYLADNFFGKYNIIVGFSIPYILGHVILGIESPIYLFIALSLLAMGSGVIKPNISTLMGMTYDQKRAGQDLLRSQAFSIFYMSINIGAGISQLAMPPLRMQYGYFIAFLFPAALMVLAFIFFAAGKPFYAKEVIQRREATPEERSLRWQVLGEIGLLFTMVMFFWAIFDQSASTWIFYADACMKNDFFGWTAEQMQSLNAWLIVALVPVVNFLFVTLHNAGLRIRATDKMVAGFILTALTMATMAYCGYQTGPPEKIDKVENGKVVMDESSGTPVQIDSLPEERRVSLWWQAIAYLFLTIAEILISVTGLELAFVAAPKTMKSFVTSLWLLAVGLASFFINAPLSRVYPLMAPGPYFAMLAGLLVVVTIAFLFVAAKFNRTVAAKEAVEERPAISDEDAERILGTPPTAGASTGIQPGWMKDGTRRSE